MTEQTNLAADRPDLDALWFDLLADALASDGPISDQDVKNAVTRARPKIEATARQQGRDEAVREIRAKVLALHPVTPAELFGILDAIAEGTAPDWKEAAVRGYRQGWADAIAGDGGDRP